MEVYKEAGLYQMNIEQALGAHYTMWHNMLKKAEAGVFPFKEAVLEEMGYNLEHMLCDCFLCTYGALNKLFMQWQKECPKPFRHVSAKNNVRGCDWCPKVFTEHEVKNGVPCMESDSPYSEYTHIRWKLTNGMLTEAEAVRDVIPALKRMLDLPTAETPEE